MIQPDALHFFERLLVRKKHTLDLAQPGHRDPIKNIVPIMHQHLGHTDQRGIKLLRLQQPGQFRWRQKLDFVLQPARQRHGVQIRHRTDAERLERALQLILALGQRGALLALKTCGQFVGRIDGSHAEFGQGLIAVVVAHAVARFPCNRAFGPGVGSGLSGAGASQVRIAS